MSENKQKAEALKRVLEGKKKEAPPSREEEALEGLTELQKKLKSAQSEAEKNYDKLLRVMAEFENYKKRIARDHAERSQYTHETILRELLKVLDDFDRIIDHLPEEKSDAIQGLIDGIHLVHKDFFNILEKFGLKPVPIENKNFDPHLHEAIAQVESNDHPEGTIVECHRKGYRLHDRLLRPAAVTVARAKGAEKGSDEKK
ncbi:MAG: nucleotide exchange factor GrpE [Deltaproteobacteria bacterium]|nr:nucleotide exchange factor GrpE [Deltaproteobacteria bacterium]